jgi:hypothetical protein
MERTGGLEKGIHASGLKFSPVSLSFWSGDLASRIEERRLPAGFPDACCYSRHVPAVPKS